MAALICIAGSLVGWALAAFALMAGSLASTAFIIFLLTSFFSTAALLFAASCRTAHDTSA
ncbi:hypothetical protein [Marivita geojedonensis]|uniref:Uncharacterized protein n=1 Tax=Marivita geojedonensis TaxID=1123756 RepID=A0A1X4NHD7_9RHOB|nr:hypothetical protein [Marivita geojedonensis]OSQ46988.1 hypothetical protein MGEO_16480 [Marivita geojedonensis]PRY74425.1 hypothetical protein CLV76_12025 [Marivita geojedonensis]